MKNKLIGAMKDLLKDQSAEDVENLLKVLIDRDQIEVRVYMILFE